MKCFFHPKNHGRHFVCFLKIFTSHKHFSDFSVFLFPVCTECIFFTQLCCIPRDPPYDLICHVKKFCCLIFLSFTAHKPVINTFKTSLCLLPEHFFRHFHFHTRNQKLIFDDLIKYRLAHITFLRFQTLLNHTDIALQTFDKTAQILNQSVFKHQKFLCAHHFLCLYAV